MLSKDDLRINNLLRLFINFRVETHFPLECPAAYFFQSCTTEKDEVTSSKSLGFELKSDKSLIQIKKRKGPRIDPSGTSAEIFDHFECWSFK